MGNLQLGLDDLRRHVVQVAYHVLPPIVLSDERTHLGLFAEEVTRRFPQLYMWTRIGPDGLRISARLNPGAEGTLDTLQVHEQGLFLTFPIEARQGSGEVLLSMPDYRPALNEVQRLFFRHIVGRHRIRVDCLRQLSFQTPMGPALPFITTRGDLGGMNLVNASLAAHFRDPHHQISINLFPRQSAGAGQMASAASGELAAVATVHSVEARPLSDAEIDGVLDRAESIWPEAILACLNGRDA